MLILASNSPRRKELLSLGGWTFKVLPAQVDEHLMSGEHPSVYVLRLAESKARDVGLRIENLYPERSLIVAADTTVALDDAILGKPENADQAREMLSALRGRAHQVYTGLAVMRVVDSKLLKEVIVSDVIMRHYSDEEIETYIASGDPMDKAGAYAIQNPEFHPVKHLQGCFANVVGLPICHLTQMLKSFGAYPLKNVAQYCQIAFNTPCPIYLQLMGE